MHELVTTIRKDGQEITLTVDEVEELIDRLLDMLDELPDDSEEELEGITFEGNSSDLMKASETFTIPIGGDFFLKKGVDDAIKAWRE